MSIKRVLVYGGNGALGSQCIKHFKSQNFWVGSIDLAVNAEADVSVIVDSADTWTAQSDSVSHKVADALGSNKLDAIVCVAGGWAGGDAAHKDFIKNCDLMYKQSVWSSTIAANLAAKHLTEDGLLTLTGAQGALQGTPGMIGYGMAKAAVHQLTKSLATKGSGLPEKSCVVTILPVTLDTPMNRKWMSKADFSTWTPLEFVAELFTSWLEAEKRPKNGSLIQLITKAGQTDCISD